MVSKFSSKLNQQILKILKIVPSNFEENFENICILYCDVSDQSHDIFEGQSFLFIIFQFEKLREDH